MGEDDWPACVASLRAVKVGAHWSATTTLGMGGLLSGTAKGDETLTALTTSGGRQVATMVGTTSGKASMTISGGTFNGSVSGTGTTRVFGDTGELIGLDASMDVAGFDQDVAGRRQDVP